MLFKHQTEEQLQILAKNLAKTIDTPVIIYLIGDLGSGKTTFARSFIKYFGFKKVKSPTYSIVEPYENNNTKIYHFDLYRLCDFEELEMIGVREYFNHTCLIEWANNFEKQLPDADIIITLSGDSTRDIEISGKLGEKLSNLL